MSDNEVFDEGWPAGFEGFAPVPASAHVANGGAL